MISCNFGAKLDRPIDRVQALETPPLLAYRDAKQVKRIGFVRLSAEQPPIGSLGFVKPSGSVMRHRLFKEATHDSPAILLQRLRFSTARAIAAIACANKADC